MKELTKIAERELHALAKSINEREGTIQKMRGITEDAASKTIAEAVLQGQELLKAKALIPHGLFLEWLAAHCPCVSRKTCWQYMKLAANVTRVTNGPESIRQALLLCQGDAEPTEKQQKDCPIDLQALYLFNRAAKFISRHPITDYPVEVVTEMRSQLEPTARLLWPERFPDGPIVSK